MKHIISLFIIIGTFAMNVSAATPVDSAAIYIQQADSAVSNARYEEALELYRQAYNCDTTCIETSISLGELSMSLEYFEYAAYWFEHALYNTTDRDDIIDLNTRTAYAIYCNIKQNYSFHNIIKQSSFYNAESEAHDYAVALKHARRAYDMLEDYNLETYSLYATLLWECDSTDMAEPIFKVMIERSPDLPYGYCGLSHCLEDRNDYEGALRAINSGFGKVKDTETLYSNSIRLYCSFENYDQAVAHLLKMIDNHYNADHEADRIAMTCASSDYIPTLIAYADKTADKSLLYQAICSVYHTYDNYDSATKYIMLAYDEDPSCIEIAIYYLLEYNKMDRVYEIANDFFTRFPDKINTMKTIIYTISETEYTDQLLKLVDRFMQVYPDDAYMSELRERLTAE